MKLKSKKRKPTRLPTINQPFAKVSSFYDLYEHGISVSFIKSWLNCREAPMLSYGRGLKSPDRVGGATWWGSYMHRLLEVCDPDTVWEEWEQDHRRIKGADYEAASIAAATIEVVFNAYRKHWATDARIVKTLAKEASFKVYIPSPLGLPNKVPLVGMRDEYFTHQDGAPWVLESKTRGRIEEESLKQHLPFDFQTRFYLKALSIEKSLDPGGVLYNVIRNPSIRQKAKESRPIFLKRLADDIKSRPEFYFKRFELPLMPGDLDAWFEGTLKPIVADIERWWLTKTTGNDWMHYRSWNCKQNWGTCEFWGICTRGDATLLQNKTHPFEHYQQH